MKKNFNAHRIFVATILAIVALFGYSNTALAAQPNYGDPITIDGDISDWDLSQDFFVVMYLDNNSANSIEADAYLRFSDGVLYILVLSRNGQNINTVNEQFVMVDQLNIQDVNQNDAPPDGTLPDFAFFNQSGTLAEGWEAAISWEDAINPELSSHQIFIHALFRAPTSVFKAFTLVPLEVFEFDFGDLADSYQTTFDPGSGAYGPVHTVGALRLGQLVDGETNGQPGPTSVNDDLTDRPDEDGVTPTGLWTVAPAVQVIVNGCTGTCFLNAWIDWDHSGSFDQPNEFVLQTTVTNGTHTIGITLPQGVTFPSTFNTRFRLCDTAEGCNLPTANPDGETPPMGEVEDYQWTFSTSAVNLNAFTVATTQSPLLLITFSVAAVTLVGLGAFITIRKSQKR